MEAGSAVVISRGYGVIVPRILLISDPSRFDLYHSLLRLLFGFFFPPFLFFLRLHLQHMEVPRLGVESELQLPAYAADTATQDPHRLLDS